MRNDLRGSYGFRILWKDGGEPSQTIDLSARDFEGDGWHAQNGKTSILVMPSAAPALEAR